MWSRTCCLYEIRPWHQLFNAFGLIDVVRHVEQNGLQILEDVQVVCFCGLDKAVADGTCLGSIDCVVEQEVLTPYDVALRSAFSR